MVGSGEEYTYPPTWSPPRSILGICPQQLDNDQSFPTQPRNHNSVLTSPKPFKESPSAPIKSIKRRILVHINPSWPGCWPILSIFLISSNVTPSLLNKPPWTTKYRFVPSGPMITVLSRGDGTGGFVAEIKVASGTKEHDQLKPKAKRWDQFAPSRCKTDCAYLL